MKHSLKPVLFIVTAFAGLAVGIVLVSFTLYQYLSLTSLIGGSPAYTIVLGQSVVNSEETNYLVIMIAAVPLICLSAFLMYRSVRRLRHQTKKAR